MRILALTDGSVKSATALDAFDGRTKVDMHVPLAPLPDHMAKPDIVVMSFVEFPEFGMKPLFAWLEEHQLVHKPRILCMPRGIARQFSASVRLFADKLLPLPLSQETMLEAVEQLDTRMPQLLRKERNESAATVQNTARKFISAFSTQTGDAKTTVVALSAATKDVCNVLVDEGISGWLDEVSDYHSTTARHCMIVAGFAAIWAKQLGVQDSDLHLFTRGALLHDIGKMHIPLHILDKPDALTEEERAVIETHPDASKRILEEAGNINPVIVDLAYSHHEMLDGSGYPRGLQGNQINDMVRCLTIVDIYAALIDQRSYKGLKTPQEAYAYLQSIPDKIDRDLVGAFGKVVEQHADELNSAGSSAAA